MVPSLTRRQHLIGAGAVVAGASITVKAKEALDESPQDMPYQSRLNAGLQTAEPIVTDTDVSTDSPYPDSYAVLIRTQEEADERYRVEYLREEYDTDVSKLYTIDYETEFIAIVGYVLPKKRRLNLTGQEYEEGTLHTTHEIIDYSGLEDLKVHHNVIIYRQQGHEPPEDIDADFCIK